jgi:hypothetical protein
MHPYCYVHERHNLVVESLKYPLEHAIHYDESTQYVQPYKTEKHD